MQNAEILAAQREWERAAEIVGCWKATWGEKRFNHYLRWQTSTHIKALEDRLGPEVYAAAVARGQSTRIEDMIEQLLALFAEETP